MDGEARLGMQVMGSDGQAGTVEDVLYDKEGRARYLVVRDRGVFGEDAVLPATDGTIGGDTIHYPMSRAQIQAAERFDPQRHGAAAGLTSAAAARYDRQDEDR